jgi:nicotinamide-nucleotide amidase
MSLRKIAFEVAKWLQKTGQKIVFAESCTAGLVSATLARVPGISDYHCGGMVVYRNATKQTYLEISAKVLKNPGAVSEIVARQMVQKILQLTPEASVGASVTGHLGPNAPLELNGQVYIGLLHKTWKQPRVISYVCEPKTSREVRQKMVAAEVLQTCLDLLRNL